MEIESVFDNYKFKRGNRVQIKGGWVGVIENQLVPGTNQIPRYHVKQIKPVSISHLYGMNLPETDLTLIQ